MAGDSQPAQPDWRLPGFAPGTLVAGYRLESRVGAGGMAMVFRARDEALGRIAALKILAPEFTDDEAFRERFIRESRAAAVVDHPHIIPVYGAGEFGGVLYIAMRFVAGGDLRALLQREGPLPSSRAAFLLSPLASALDAGHAAGLVHRDVKPANILIDTSPGRPDHLYLADFGIAKGSATTGLTGTGHFMGTLDYCAPEQINGKPARPPADQYALGCVAYTMLTGTVPFPRDEVIAVLWAHISDPPPPVTALRADLPPAVDRVLARAMAKVPEDRYPTCTEFAEAFRAALGLDAYTTSSSAYASGSTGPPPAGSGGQAAAVVPVPAPPSPISAPPAPAPALQPQLARVSSPAAVLAAAQSGSPPELAETAGEAIPPRGSSLPPEASVFQGAAPVRRRGRRLGLLAAGAVVVAAAVLAISWHGGGSPPGSSNGSPPASAAYLPPAPTTSPYPPPLATLTEPGGAVAIGVAFTSAGTLVTVDASGAYSWNIATGSPTPADPQTASTFVSIAQQQITAETIGVASLVNVAQVWNASTGEVIATLTAPSGTAVNAFALSPDGTEAAVSDTDGRIYVWNIPQ